MKPSLDELQRRCPEVNAALIGEHLARLEERYFDLFEQVEICEHLRAVARLSPEEPVQALIRTSADQGVECTLVAFDYPGEFSILTGILAASGFNIHSGDVFTYAPPQAAPGTGRLRWQRRSGQDARWALDLRRRKIIDHLCGRLESSQPIEVWESRLRLLLGEAILILEKGGSQALPLARQRVNELVADRLASLTLKSEAVLYPVHISARQDRQGRTLLKVVSQDTPFFLYTLSTALSLRSIFIEYIRIRTVDNRIEDEFSFIDSQGRMITEAALLDQVKLSVLLTKQFSYFLGSAPDPYAALCRFETLVESVLPLPEQGRWSELLSDPLVLQELARLLGASDFLWEDFIRLQYESLLPMLAPHVRGQSFAGSLESLPSRLERSLGKAGTLASKRQALNEFKDREIFLLELDYIVSPEADFQKLAGALTRVAEEVINSAVRLAYEHLASRFGSPLTVAGLPAEHALLGLGKLGGGELGYASDIELLFVYSDNGTTGGREAIRNAEFFDLLVREACGSIRAKKQGIFQIDLRLRPYGASGPVACSLETFCWYFGPQGEAHALERLALVRLRALGGSPGLGAQLERIRDELLYSGAAIDLNKLNVARQKQLDARTRRGELNAKLSPGALMDLEQTIMLLQVRHGAEHPELRTPFLREALDRLPAAGILSQAEAEGLNEAYRFLRRLINGLRMLRGSALDLYLPAVDSDEYVHLARRMGYAPGPELSPAQKLHLDFETHTATVRYFVEKHFGRETLPASTVGNVADLILSDSIPAAMRERILRRAGFRQAEKAYRNLRSLAAAGGSGGFARLAVLATDLLKHRPDPDMALNNWERFISSLREPGAHFQLLLSQPRRLDILLAVFSGSQFLSDTLIYNPEFFEWVTLPEHLHRVRQRAEMLEFFRELSRGSTSHFLWLNSLRRYRKREFLRIGIRDICLGAPIQEIMIELSMLADAILQATLERAWADLAGSAQPAGQGTEGLPFEEFCILAFGKLGGEELNYSSDIDLLAVGGPGIPAERLSDLNRVMERLRADLSSHCEEGYAYRVDLRLRPYGRAGELVSGLASVSRYYREDASLWEVQALLKARPVAGNLTLGGRLLEELFELYLRGYSSEEIVRSIESLRQAAQAKLARGLVSTPNIKEGIGGIRDVEFLVQGLQLMHARSLLVGGAATVSLPGRGGMSATVPPAAQAGASWPQQRGSGVLAGNTLAALEALRLASVLPPAAVEQLKRDYLFLRRIEHYLQIFEDRQTHTLPTEGGQLEALARRMLGVETGAARFLEQLDACLKRVAGAYETYLLGRKN